MVAVASRKGSLDFADVRLGTDPLASVVAEVVEALVSDNLMMPRLVRQESCKETPL